MRYKFSLATSTHLGVISKSALIVSFLQHRHDFVYDFDSKIEKDLGSKTKIG